MRFLLPVALVLLLGGLAAANGSSYSASTAPACRDYLHLPTGLVLECEEDVPWTGLRTGGAIDDFVLVFVTRTGDPAPLGDAPDCAASYCADVEVALVGEHEVAVRLIEGSVVDTYAYPRPEPHVLTYLRFHLDAWGDRGTVVAEVLVDGVTIAHSSG